MPFANESQWMKTTNCFPNDQIIPLQYIAYLRLFQNLIVVVCFATIFILYALICVRVTRRRQLKADRDQHYKELLDRSKRNTMATASVIGLETGTVIAPSLTPKVNEYSYVSPNNKNSISMLSHTRMPTELSDPFFGQPTTTTFNSDIKSSLSFPEINDQETCLIVAPDTENNKSTQTVKSAISLIKK